MKKILFGFLSLAAVCAFAASNTTTMVVAFPPGGPVDSMARSLVEPLGKELGTQIIIENKPGGNGAIAAQYLASNPDNGKTIWFTSAGAVAINPGRFYLRAFRAEQRACLWRAAWRNKQRGRTEKEYTL